MISKKVKHFHGRSMSCTKQGKFTAQVDDIEEFVRDVQETATQLIYDDAAVYWVQSICLPCIGAI